MKKLCDLTNKQEKKANSNHYASTDVLNLQNF